MVCRPILTSGSRPWSRQPKSKRSEGMPASVTFAYVLLAFALAVGGGAMGAALARSHRRLCALISLGAGTLLGVTLFAILPESLEEMHWWGVLLALGSGYGLFFLITKYIFHFC